MTNATPLPDDVTERERLAVILLDAYHGRNHGSFYLASHRQGKSVVFPRALLAIDAILAAQVAPREVEPLPTVRIVSPHVSDEPTKLYVDDKQVGYVDAESGWLHMFGADGYAVAVCEVRDDSDIRTAATAHFEALRNG